MSARTHSRTWRTIHSIKHMDMGEPNFNNTPTGTHFLILKFIAKHVSVK
jgi:hypothetical protein